MTENQERKEAAARERAVTAAVAADIEGSATGVWTGSYVNLIKERYPDLDLIDIRVFGRVCLARGIDPLVGDMYPIVYGKDKPRGGKNGRTLVLIESIDSMRKRAWATNLVAEIKGPEWCGPDGEWTDVWLQDEVPMAARFGVRRKGMDEIAWHVRLMKEVRKTGDGDQFWRDSGDSAQPVNMIGIAAERHGWRKTVPNLFATIYGETSYGHDGPVQGQADVNRLPEYVDIDQLGPVVADEDGVLDDESSPPTDAPDPEWDASTGPPDESFNVDNIVRILWPRMRDSTPPWGWQHLEAITGWPEGADREDGIRALLAGAVGSEDELAGMVFDALEATRA